jgi:hypothetical protein
MKESLFLSIRGATRHPQAKNEPDLIQKLTKNGLQM